MPNTPPLTDPSDKPVPTPYREQFGPGYCYTCGAAVGQVHDDDCPHRAMGPQAITTEQTDE